jgi:large subunit ribosomal protein L6
MKIIEKRIKIPEGMKVEIEAKKIKISNEKGSIERSFKVKEIDAHLENGEIYLKTKNASKKTYAMLNTLIAHLKNIFDGLSQGYEYKLAIVFSHFPINASVKGKIVEINNFLGEKTPRKAKIIGKAKGEIKGQDIFVRGINKEEVGQTAANLENATKISGRDIRRFQDGIYVVEKGVKTEKQG